MVQRDLSAFFEDDGLEYPGVPSTAHPGGHTYKVPSPDAKTGLWLTVLADVGMKAAFGGDLSDKDMASVTLDDDEEKTLYQRVLGPVYEQMIVDGVSWGMLQRIGQDAYLCFGMSQAVADQAMERPGEAAARANRATRRTAPKTAGSSSSGASTGTPARTRARASTRSSTSRNAPAAKKAG